MRIAISTGGGDAPGLNAVIRAVVLAAHQRGWQCYGIRRGFGGLLANDGIMTLNPAAVRGITHLGGTILGTTNRGNPFRWATPAADGSVAEVDRSDDLIAAFRASGFDALVSIGGDGSLRIAHDLWRKGLPVVGVPKTIDNDVFGTLVTFGFDTAVTTATEAIDKLHTTAESHDRVMVVELMGRDAGWIALHSAVSSSADIVLLPELPFDIERVCEAIRQREASGRHYSIVVVAEGARPKDGSTMLAERRSAGTVDRLGGIGGRVAASIAERTGKETRSLVLGHLQRGGTPTTFDRLIALRFGTAAVRAIAAGDFGTMVAYTPPTISTIPLADVIGRTKHVPLDSDTLQTARDLGISFGD
ncbi:MAG TPA: ATP-dependent 6-phosphofructokinase [Gemmatimonadales bacterium]|jgi:ATP-dependent phosphofructokinase / diphosphate-dependent phosphofructokinase|nr:ATP-dependent 6-phosphofructokinase [Gemmatimonadales bacterium]